MRREVEGDVMEAHDTAREGVREVVYRDCGNDGVGYGHWVYMKKARKKKKRATYCEYFAEL